MADKAAPRRVIRLLREVRACTLCAPYLPQRPRPLLQLHPQARILIAAQAPGRRADATGIPFDDPSGERLCAWLGIDEPSFHDPLRIAILPMAMCYPGKGVSGDLPPRRECAPAWREQLLAQLPNIELTLAIGSYAQAWHLGAQREPTLTATVRAWRRYWPALLPLPHPSPRNNGWLAHQPWFEHDVLPSLRERVRELMR